MNGAEQAKERCSKRGFPVAMSRRISKSDLFLQGLLLVQPWRYIRGHKETYTRTLDKATQRFVDQEKCGMFWHAGVGLRIGRAYFAPPNCLLQTRGAAICFPSTKAAAILVAKKRNVYA